MLSHLNFSTFAVLLQQNRLEQIKFFKSRELTIFCLLAPVLKYTKFVKEKMEQSTASKENDAVTYSR